MKNISPAKAKTTPITTNKMMVTIPSCSSSHFLMSSPVFAIVKLPSFRCFEELGEKVIIHVRGTNSNPPHSMLPIMRFFLQILTDVCCAQWIFILSLVRSVMYRLIRPWSHCWPILNSHFLPLKELMWHGTIWAIAEHLPSSMSSKSVIISECWISAIMDCTIAAWRKSVVRLRV